ncbi:MAG: hypothetical protein GC200_11585 [Tepidisphaera sp.]|nr:hypothetical protein [Tepidisphaera sp.]
MSAPRKSLANRWPLLALALGGLALLIWLKLRVMTGVPRTAYADPSEAEKAKQAVTQPQSKALTPEDAATLGTLSSSGPAPR